MVRTSKRAAVLVAALALGTLLAGLPAQAHGPDTAGWIEQAGNGSGESKPVIPGLEVGTVLFSANRFGVPTGGQSIPRSTSKYIAWGTTPVTGGAQLWMIRSGDDGISFAAPQPARLRDPNGVDVPFILNSDSGSGFDVIFTTFVDAPFIIFYRAAGTAGTLPGDVHSAFSEDGVEWYQDGGMLENVAGSFVGGGGFKSKIVAPSDVVWNLAGTTTNSTCFAAASPYACRYIMYYTTQDPAGNTYTSIARSGTGVTWAGTAAPVLSPGIAGSWDDRAAGNLTLQQLSGSSFRGLYSGNQLGGASSIGWVTSADGVTFTKAATNPATPPAMFDAAATPTGTSSLTKAQFLADASSEHTRVYTTRKRSSGGDAYLGATSPAPTTAPHIRVSSPVAGEVLGPKVPVTIYMGDTLGATPGLNLQTLSVTIDGVGGPALGLLHEDTIVAQFKLAGKKITGLPTLADGAHTLVASVADRDGEVTTVSVTFRVDALAPNTTMTLSPAGTEIGFVDSPGTFGGTVIDPPGGTGIDFVSAVVTNPLGMRKTYTTHAPFGWQVSKVSDSHWNVIWTAPILDPHFLVPGEYTVSLLGTDRANNVEKADLQNTASVTVI